MALLALAGAGEPGAGNAGMGDARMGDAGMGDVGRGLAVVTRQASTCVLCHSGPWPNPHLQGNIAPDLRGVGSRLTQDALRARIAVGDPDGVMPAFGATGGVRVGAAWAGRPILSPAEIEDVVAYLAGLTAP